MLNELHRSYQKRENAVRPFTKSLVLAAFFASGFVMTYGLTGLIFEGWAVTLASIFGGFWGLSVIALIQVGANG